MVLKNLIRIREALPEAKDIVMFYNDGTVFQTTFETPVNVPKLGKNLSELLVHYTNLYECCQTEPEIYRKIIYETKDHLIILLKVGENSNLALFLDKIEDTDVKLHSIRRYIDRVERLIDMDRLELDKKRLEVKKGEIENIVKELKPKSEKLEKMEADVENLDYIIIKKKEDIKPREEELERQKEIREKRGLYLKERKELLKSIDDESKDLVKAEIKKEEESLDQFDKELDEQEKDYKNILANIEKDAQEKEKMCQEVENLREECKNLQDSIKDKVTVLAEIEEDIEKREKEKFEDKLLD